MLKKVKKKKEKNTREKSNRNCIMAKLCPKGKAAAKRKV